MKLFNSLNKKIEEFIPIKDRKVGIYSCGPTVYWNQHIGHMYAYAQWDILVRFLRFLGYNVNWIMNVTDVGHMTSDEDMGEDKMEKGAKREGLSVWDLANKYINQFTDSLDLMNIKRPDTICRATENIAEQIDLIKLIEKNGFTYQTKKGVVFDTSKFPDYAKFAGLKLDKLKKREDVEVDVDKKVPWDFFLWVISPNHIMQWDSPWGRGYPGWHIECTAMSTKYLGNKFDIHTGGIEHRPVHHTNEVAQGFAAFGTQTANFWLHNAHLMGKGGVKMSKSLGNFLTAQELVEKGYDPLALRYLYLTSHYRNGLNFTFESLESSQIALGKLRLLVSDLKTKKERTVLSKDKLKKVDEFRRQFTLCLSDDLNTPQALAVVWSMLKSNIPSGDKYDLVLSFDEVLGLGLTQVSIRRPADQIPKEIQKLVDQREKLRSDGKWQEADALRMKVEGLGYKVEDTPGGVKILPNVEKTYAS